jgi:hypothetical protein
MIRHVCGVLAAVMVLGCSGSGSTTGGGGGGSSAGGSAAGGTASNGGGTSANGGGSGAMGGGGTMMATVPDPGTSNKVDNEWADVEPNDTPSQATPLGTAGGDIYTWVSNNAAGGSNSQDYFVFKSGPGPDAGSLSFDMCWQAPITNMNASLWKVSGGVQQQPAIASWTGSGTCVTDMAMTAPLAPSTVYLFGLTITGGDGGAYFA